MSSLLFIVVAILIVVVSVIFYIKMISRNIPISEENTVYTKELLKENPKLFEKFLDDCTKDNMLDEKLKSMKLDLEKELESKTEQVNKKLFDSLSDLYNKSVLKFKEDIQSYVSQVIKEEKLLEETS